MGENSKAIIILCSHLCVGENIKPYEPAAWSKLADKLGEINLTPEKLINLSSQELRTHFDEEEASRIENLVKRSGSIFFEINKYKEQGLNIVTRADTKYPQVLKNLLGKQTPPLFYYVGNIELCNRKAVGFVGSRDIEIEEHEFTTKYVQECVKNGYTIVSGGARGVDSISTETALKLNGLAIEYVADSLIKKLKNKETIKAIRENRLVILSQAKPEAGFNAGLAMNRNKYIYAQSQATIVVRSDFEKGGTWSGATEAIRKKYTTVLCNKNEKHKGNMELIKKGAIALTEDLDFTTQVIPVINQNSKKLYVERLKDVMPQQKQEQLSLFE